MVGESGTAVGLRERERERDIDNKELNSIKGHIRCKYQPVDSKY